MTRSSASAMPFEARISEMSLPSRGTADQGPEVQGIAGLTGI